MRENGKRFILQANTYKYSTESRVCRANKVRDQKSAKLNKVEHRRLMYSWLNPPHKEAGHFYESWSWSQEL